MAKDLSQEDIDSIVSGSEEPQTATPASAQGMMKDSVYDFRHPNRLSKGQLVTLRTIHEGYARILSTYLTTLLRTIVDVRFVSVDQVILREFTTAMGNPDCIWTFGLKGDQSKGVLEIAPDLVFIIIDRLFGGEGEVEGDARSLSIIEQNVVGKIIEKFLKIYHESWIKTVDVQTKLHSFEANPQLIQIAPPNEVAVVHFLEVHAYDATFPMNVCFPYFILDELLSKASTATWDEEEKAGRASNAAQTIEQVIRGSLVDFSVQLGDTSLLFREVMELSEGDVIVLDHRKDDLCRAKVGDRVHYLGTVGLSGNRLAFQVEDFVDADSQPDG